MELTASRLCLLAVIAGCDPVIDGTTVPDVSTTPRPDVAYVAPQGDACAVRCADVGESADASPGVQLLRDARPDVLVGPSDSGERATDGRFAADVVNTDTAPSAPDVGLADGAPAVPDAAADGGPSALDAARAAPDDAAVAVPPDAAPDVAAPDDAAVAAPTDAAPDDTAVAPPTDAMPDDAAVAAPADTAFHDATVAPPPDAATCPDDILSAELVDGRLYVRNETAEIRYAALDGYAVRAEAVEGGFLSEDDGRVFFTARGGQPGHLGWPHWTGAVVVRLTASHPDSGCEATVEVGVPVAGDVLQGDGSGGRIAVYGSDGAYLGDLPPLTQRGVLWLDVVPPSEAFAGGVAALVWRSDGESPEIRLLDRRGVGLPVEFEMETRGGEPVYPNRPPHGLFVHDGIILADRGEDCQVHRWNLEGDLVDALAFPCDGSNGSRVTGFASLDGDLVVGYNATRLYDQQGNLRIDTGTVDSLRGFVPGHDGEIVVSGYSGTSRMWSFDRNGVLLHQVSCRPGQYPYIVRFLDGYLQREPEIGLYLRRRDLTPVDLGEAWNHGLVGLWWSSGGLVWLDDGTWP